MATSSFTRKIIVTGKEATDMLIDAITSDVPLKNVQETEKFLEENRRKETELLKQFASLYKK